MPRNKLSQPQLASLAIVLAAAAITGCQGGLAVTDAPERSFHAESRRAAPAKVDRAEDQDKAAEGEGEVADEPDPDERTTDGDRAEAERDSSVQFLAIQTPETTDLEFSEGLAEPPQQKVVPAPAPWTPAPGAEAGAKPIIEDVWPVKGPVSGGDRVVIRGKNLDAAQVVFGLAPAQIISVSEAHDTLTVAVPACGAGQVAIVVTNRDGNYAVAGGTFEYYN